jgi:AAA+ superfamily predicted ATPase
MFSKYVLRILIVLTPLQVLPARADDPVEAQVEQPLTDNFHLPALTTPIVPTTPTQLDKWFSNPIKFTSNEIKLDEMVGRLPIKLTWIIKQLKERRPISKRILLLHGKPGNGKTTLARKIAQAADFDFIDVAAPSIVGSYVGQGAQNVATLFETAFKRNIETDRPVLIFIDEIDAIASNVKTEFRAEHKVALQQLWLEIDKYKKDDRFYIILATNHMDKLDRTFLDRFGGNVIEIALPDACARKEIIKFYSDKLDISFKDETIEELVTKSEGLSVRAIEDLINDTYMTAQISNNGIISKAMLLEALKQTKHKFDVNKTDEEENDKKLQKISTYVSIISGVLSAAVNAITLGQIIQTGINNYFFTSAVQKTV